MPGGRGWLFENERKDFIGRNGEGIDTAEKWPNGDSVLLRAAATAGR
jgi:hypothetical protein